MTTKHSWTVASALLALCACDDVGSRRTTGGPASGDGGQPDASHAVDANGVDAGPDAGLGDGGPSDSGPTDSGPTDAGPADSGPADSGPTDSGPSDSGPADSGPTDSGPADSGPADSGPADSGPRDSGPTDSGPADSGPTDGGLSCVPGGAVKTGADYVRAIAKAVSSDRIFLGYEYFDPNALMQAEGRIALPGGSFLPSSGGIGFGNWVYVSSEGIAPAAADWSPSLGRFGMLMRQDPAGSGSTYLTTFPPSGAVRTDVLVPGATLPSVLAAGDAGAWLGCWLADDDFNGKHELYCATITGSTVGARKTIHAPTSGSVLRRAAAGGAFGGYALVWSANDVGDTETESTLYSVLLDATGAPASPGLTVAGGTGMLHGNPVFAHGEPPGATQGGIAWYAANPATSTTEIRFGRLDYFGISMVTTLSSSAFPFDPPVVVRKGDRYLILWEEAPGGSASEVFGAEVSATDFTVTRAKRSVAVSVQYAWPVAALWLPGGHIWLAMSTSDTVSGLTTVCVPP